MSEAVENQQKVKPLRKKTEERAYELQQLQETLAAQEAALEQLTQEINQREEALGVLRRSLAEYDELLEATYAADDDQPDEYRIALALTLANAAYDALLVVDEHTRILASNKSAEILFNNPRPRGRMLV